MADHDLRVQITTPDLRALHSADDMDPDISATLTDFLAFTEHLPSAVVRSMSLIAEQDKIATEFQHKLHDLLAAYGGLPSSGAEDGSADAVTLRRQISHAYQRVEKARRMSAAESLRMVDLVHKDQVRLGVIQRKLNAMPMPPSRDPTPEPAKSPQLKRSQPVAEKRAAHRIGSAPRGRERKIMVPGEVLPPPNPDSPPASDISDDDSIDLAPATDRKRHKTPNRPRTPKPPKEKKEKKDRTPKIARIRLPGQSGTNVHSQVAGISTSNALLALVAPPPDAAPGSKWLPWKRITEFELAKLRKRMKKNAIWLPSPAMRNRELKVLGRGQQAMEIARQAAAENGTEFIDEFGPDWQDPTRAVMSGDDTAALNEVFRPEVDNGDEDEALMNRGMRLNEAKKRKRERMLEEAAIQAQLDAEQRASEGKPPLDPAEMTTSPKPSKKRKRDSTPAVNKDAKPVISITTSQDQPQKRLKLAAASSNPNLTVPLLSPIIAAEPAPVPTTSSARRDTAVPRITLKRTTKAASAEPPLRRLRRGSASSLPGAHNRAGSVDSRRISTADTAASAPSTTATAGGASSTGRRRRPAPGLITADEDGRAKVSVGKRKAAPRKKKGAAAAVVEAQQQQGDESGAGGDTEVEIIDPDEPRYCLCGDVSWGTMIACDNEDCEKEWFHLSCVDLQDMPPRRTRWYCPDCRKKLKKGQGTNGIVKL